MGGEERPDPISSSSTVMAGGVSTPYPSADEESFTSSMASLSTSSDVVQPLTVLNVDDFFLIKASSECKCMQYVFDFISFHCLCCLS